MRLVRKISRGDTIIEVMFSIVIFSLVVVSSMAIMNKGVAMAQRSVEITLVRQQIDSQLAMLEYVQRFLPVEWKSIKDKKAVVKSDFMASKTCPTAADLTSAMFLTKDATTGSILVNNVTAANYNKAVNYSMVDYMNTKTTTGNVRAYGLWMQITDSEVENDSNVGQAYDVHIRACWDSVGLSVPMTISTVARMYDGQ